MAELVPVVESYCWNILYDTVLVKFIRHLGISLQFRTSTGYVQPNTTGIFTETDSLKEGRLIFLRGGTTYINEIERPILIQVVCRRGLGA
jgi:hypothetical protein